MSQDPRQDEVVALWRRWEREPEADWAPVAMALVRDAALAARAFDSLRLELQFDVLERLKADGGHWADMVVSLLALHGAEIADEQVRQYALDDAAEARGRLLGAVESIAAGLAPGPVLDLVSLAVRIARADAGIAALRAAEHASNEAFAEIHALERDILRHEARRRFLDGYDVARAHLAVRAEAEVLEAREREKSDLERRVGLACGERDGVRREVILMERSRDEAEAEARRVSADLVDVRRDLSQRLVSEQEYTEAAAAREGAAARDEAEARALRVGNEALQNRNQTQAEEVARLRRSSTADMDAIEGRWQALVRSLPDDLSDAVFQSAGAGRRGRSG